ncbi:MAG: hypothetical protein ACR2JW_14985, partial [Thermomicrobiales bacterium]
DTFGGFVARAAALGFAATDTKEARIAQHGRATGARYRLLKGVLARLGLLHPAYRLYRYAVVSTFEVALRPVEVSS